MSEMKKTTKDNQQTLSANALKNTQQDGRKDAPGMAGTPTRRLRREVILHIGVTQGRSSSAVAYPGTVAPMS